MDLQEEQGMMGVMEGVKLFFLLQVPVSPNFTTRVGAHIVTSLCGVCFGAGHAAPKDARRTFIAWRLGAPGAIAWRPGLGATGGRRGLSPRRRAYEGALELHICWCPSCSLHVRSLLGHRGGSARPSTFATSTPWPGTLVGAPIVRHVCLDECLDI